MAKPFRRPDARTIADNCTSLSSSYASPSDLPRDRCSRQPMSKARAYMQRSNYGRDPLFLRILQRTVPRRSRDLPGYSGHASVGERRSYSSDYDANPRQASTVPSVPSASHSARVTRRPVVLQHFLGQTSAYPQGLGHHSSTNRSTPNGSYSYCDYALGSQGTSTTVSSSPGRIRSPQRRRPQLGLSLLHDRFPPTPVWR